MTISIFVQTNESNRVMMDGNHEIQKWIVCAQKSVSTNFVYLDLGPILIQWTMSCWPETQIDLLFALPFFVRKRGRGSSVGRAHHSWWEGRGCGRSCGRPLPTGWVGVSIMWPAEAEVMVSQLCLVSGSTWTCQTSVLGPVGDIA